jgi:hypothetical protein
MKLLAESIDMKEVGRRVESSATTRGENVYEEEMGGSGNEL